MEDSHLITGLRSGSADSAEFLVDRFAQPLIRYFQVHLPDPQAAEDMTQEVFLRFIRRVRLPDGTVESPSGLIFAIARNLAADCHRSAERKPPPQPLTHPQSESGDEHARDIATEGAPDPREAASRSEEWALVQSALRELEPKTREIIVLRHVEGMTCPAIAKQLGIAEGTVWSQLHRGLETLRERLNPRPATSPSAKRRTLP